MEMADTKLAPRDEMESCTDCEDDGIVFAVPGIERLDFRIYQRRKTDGPDQASSACDIDY